MQHLVFARPVLIMLAILLGSLLIACDRASELIPGSEDDLDAQSLDAGAEPSPEASPIMLAPTSLGRDGQSSPATSGPPDHELARSVLQVRAVEEGAAGAARDGSGVVVDQDERLILTTYAVVDPFRSDGTTAYNDIVIATNRDPGSDPQPEFEAEIVAADPANDLAVLRATRDVAGEPLGDDAFGLPAVAIGDAPAAQAGDLLRLFGHPGIESEATAQAVTVTNTEITGLRGLPERSGRVWFKTDARLPYGASGGPAFDQSGALVGLLSQERYSPGASVGQVRPIDHAGEIIQQAREAAPDAVYQPPLHASFGRGSDSVISDRTSEADIWVSKPVFAENAIESQATRDLFDYSEWFARGTPELYYEFAAQGIPDGAQIDERWFLDDVQQDLLSSSYTWDKGGFGMVSDRILVPSVSGIPVGRWRLEIWIEGELYASSVALVAVEERTPAITAADFGTRAATDRPQGGPITGSDRLLFFFNYDGMEAAREMRWRVFHNGQRVYESAPIEWHGDPAGEFWVGYHADDPLAPGRWEFEVEVDGAVAGVGATDIS